MAGREPIGWPRRSPRPRPGINPGNRDGGQSERRPMVLLVDDNADMREYVRGLLSGRFEVVAAGMASQRWSWRSAFVPTSC